MVSSLAARDVVAAVAAAARRWSNPNHEPRRHAVVAAANRTGYSQPVVETALDRLFAPLNATAIEAAIAAELGSLQVLDRFVAREGVGRVRALPIGRACILSSRTTIGVALVPAVFALCAGCDVLVKDREDRLVEAFFETLCAQEPVLRQRTAASRWRGEDDCVDLDAFDLVVAFGSNDTLSAIARRLPLKTRFIPNGSAAGAGYVAARTLDDEATAREIARGAARDALLYDGEGCMSLHVLFLESSAQASSTAFTELLREAFAETARLFPVSTSPVAVARTAMHRDEAIMAASLSAIFSDEGAQYLVVAPSNGSPPLLAPRVMNLVSVHDMQEAVAYLKRHGITLETLAVSDNGQEYADFAAACGASRITTFGAMQSPPPGSPHGGRPRIAEFVRWIADET